MEDDLNILKVEHLNNHWSDFPQILKLSLEDQTKIKNASNEDDIQLSNGRRPQILKMEYLIKHTDRIFLKFKT